MRHFPQLLAALSSVLAFGLYGAAATPAYAVSVAVVDVMQIPAGTRERTRYLWLSEKTAADRKLAWLTVTGHLNATSRSPVISAPVVVLNTGQVIFGSQVQDWASVVLIRLIPDDYGLSRKTWDDLGFQDPYFHVTVRKWFDAGPTWQAGNYDVLAASPVLAETEQQKGSIATLLNLTQSKTPILRADNFIWQTAIQDGRRVGYYGMIGVKNRNDFERLVGLDRKASTAFASELLAVVTNSGVSREPRRVGRFVTLGGGAWFTNDVKFALNEFNPIRFINGGYKHNAEEWFAHLPNGFLAVGLFDDKGNRQDSAPDFVGYDHFAHSNDGRIHIYLSCFRCHTNAGLQDIKDSIRNLYTLPQVLQSPDPFKLSKARDQYFQHIAGKLRRDRDIYSEALLLANGLKPEEHAKNLSAYFVRYDRPVTAEQAAEEFGVPLDAMLSKFDAMRKTPAGLDPVLGFYTVDAARREPIPRNQFNEVYNLGQLALRGLTTWPNLK